MDVNAKRQHEKEVVEKMIHIYCRGNHGTMKGELCSECQELLDYAKVGLKSVHLWHRRHSAVHAKSTVTART